MTYCVQFHGNTITKEATSYISVQDVRAKTAWLKLQFLFFWELLFDFRLMKNCMQIRNNQARPAYSWGNECHKTLWSTLHAVSDWKSVSRWSTLSWFFDVDKSLLSSLVTDFDLKGMLQHYGIQVECRHKIKWHSVRLSWTFVTPGIRTKRRSFFKSTYKPDLNFVARDCWKTFIPLLYRLSESLSTARPHKISWQVLSSHSIVSSSRTVRPCCPCGGRWIGQWRTAWSTMCSSAPHSQAAEGAISHLCKLDRKSPTTVRSRLNRTQGVLGKAIPRGWVPMSGIKVRSLVVFSNHFSFH